VSTILDVGEVNKSSWCGYYMLEHWHPLRHLVKMLMPNLSFKINLSWRKPENLFSEKIYFFIIKNFLTTTCLWHFMHFLSPKYV